MSGYDWVVMFHMHVMRQAGIIQPTRAVCVGWSSDLLHRIGAAPLHAAMTPPTPRVDTRSPAKHPDWHIWVLTFVHRLMKVISVVRPGFWRNARSFSSCGTTKATSSYCPDLPRPRRPRNSSDVSDFHRERGSSPVPACWHIRRMTSKADANATSHEGDTHRYRGNRKARSY